MVVEHAPSPAPGSRRTCPRWRRRARWLRSASSSCAAARRRRALRERGSTTSTRCEPRNASMAAPPVSPEVAPTIVARCAALGQHAVHEARQQLHRHVLEGERRPVEQLEDPAVGLDLHQRRHRRMAEAGVGVARPCARSSARGIAPPVNGWMTSTATSANGMPANDGDRLRRQRGQVLRHVEPAVARQPGQQRRPRSPAGAPRLWSRCSSTRVVLPKSGLPCTLVPGPGAEQASGRRGLAAPHSLVAINPNALAARR